MANDKKIEYVLSVKDLFSKSMKNAQTETGKLDQQMSKVSESSGFMGAIVKGNLLTNAISSAGRAAKDFAVSSVQSYMKMEMYEARMTTLLHSRKSATLAISNIVQDAAKTPFDLQTLIQANSMLIGAGESSQAARKATMDLGNAIAATGGGSDELNRMAVNMSQIKSIGKASAMDVKQFMFAGIPIYEMLSKSMKKNVADIKGMDISYKDLTKAMADARKEGGMFYQGLENANRTLTGSASNLGDAWDQLKTSIGKSQSGILKDTIQWASGMLSEINVAITNQNKLSDALKGGGAKGYSLAEMAQAGGGSNFRAGAGMNTSYLRNSILSMRLSKMTSAANETEIGSKQMEIGLRKALVNLTNKYQSGGVSAVEYNRQRAILRGGLSETLNAQNEFALSKQKEKEAKEGAAKEKSDKTNLGSSTDAYGARPQNLTINITKLVENFSVNTTNMQESSQKIKEETSKALLEAVNDINQLIK